MKKRLLSAFMALALCLTLLPTAAFAAEPNVTESGTGTTTEEKENEIVVPTEQNGSGNVAKVGDTEYATLQEILDKMEEVEITLLASVTEDLSVSAATTINMAGFTITGDIEAYDSLTLTNGTVVGDVKVDGGTFAITAPAGTEAAITGELNVVSGSCEIKGA